MQRARPKQKPRVTPADRLLDWYGEHAREFPWRAPPGVRPDPYCVWLSEIMLQQTTVRAVAPRYLRFLARWPTVGALAAAPLDDVLGEWAGLGYYARARNLHRAARVVAHEMGGVFPPDARGLRALPGVGPYTAAAIAAIAFGAREAALDANAERVVARMFAIGEPLPKAKPRLRALLEPLVPERRAGDFAQALMDLGAEVCTPLRPQCPHCPWNGICEGWRRGIAARLPVKAGERPRPLRRGAAFVARDRGGAVLLERRPERGLLGGMLQPPLGPWTDAFPDECEARAQAPFAAEWKKLPGVVRHGFTHFVLELEVYAARLRRRPAARGSWLGAPALARAALPTAMRKVLAHAAQASSARNL